MIVKAAIPHQLKFKLLPGFHAILFTEKRDIHYIGGTEILPAPLEPEEENAAILDLESEFKEEARKKLIEHNLRLVVYIAKKFDNVAEDQDDLISIGTIGLIKAINTFNPGKKAKLGTYAARCIENEILMHIRAQRKHKCEVSLNEPIGTDSEGNQISLRDILGTDGDMVAEEVEQNCEYLNLLCHML